MLFLSTIGTVSNVEQATVYRQYFEREHTMNNAARSMLSVSVALTMTAHHAQGQWTDDPMVHQVVADGPGEQVQPKLSPTTDGGCYVSWYSSQTGYDVRLQRLDASGTPLWGDNGILVADRGFSSTQDYDLETDSAGFAVLTFRDDRSGQVRIGAQRVAPDGSFVWGASGLQFGDPGAFLASPDIAPTTDGGVVIGWSSDDVTKLAKVNADGTLIWETTISEPGNTVLISAMHGSDNGSVVVSWVQYESFFGPKSLYAQKINLDGTEDWAKPAAVFDGGSLQFGNFPEFVASPDGTSTFSWYDTANILQVYVQRLASDGTELFAHNGVAASTAPRERVSPTATYDPATDTTYVSWVELANNQGDQGVYAQAFDTTGTRLWGSSGVEISPTDSNESGAVNAQVLDNNLVVAWIENTGSFGSDVINATRIDTKGNTVWGVDLASDPGERARLTTTTSSDGFLIGAWQIGDFGVADIESHNLNPDGTLGASAGCPADLSGDGNLDFFDVSAFLNAYNAMDTAADFTGDGLYDFFDVSAFLSAYNTGCP